MDMLKISQVYDDNIALRKELLPIFITVDPDRDNQKAIKNFVENFNDAFIGLTGTKDEINKVIKSFKIYVNYNKKNLNDKSYLVDHSSLIFLMDENDQFLGLLRPNEVSIEKIKKYLKEVI
jgi:protein SCO1/2